MKSDEQNTATGAGIAGTTTGTTPGFSTESNFESKGADVLAEDAPPSKKTFGKGEEIFKLQHSLNEQLHRGSLKNVKEVVIRKAGEQNLVPCLLRKRMEKGKDFLVMLSGEGKIVFTEKEHKNPALIHRDEVPSDFHDDVHEFLNNFSHGISNRTPSKNQTVLMKFINQSNVITTGDNF